jgi:acyl-CoA thioester hydrolase
MRRSDFWHLVPFRVRFYEADAQGILFNAAYLAFFDTAIIEYLRALPFDWNGERARSNTELHTVRALVDYHAPVRFDDEIEIGTRIAKLGRSSMTFRLSVFPKGGDRLLSSGEVVWVNADRATHKSTPLPETLRANVLKRESLDKTD